MFILVNLFHYSISQALVFRFMLDTLKMCLGTPEIAHNLVRYPVIPKGEFKYVHVCGVCVCVCVCVRDACSF